MSDVYMSLKQSAKGGNVYCVQEIFFSDSGANMFIAEIRRLERERYITVEECNRFSNNLGVEATGIILK